MRKRFYMGLITALLALVVGCTTTTTTKAGVHPLWDAGNTRDKIIVLSDIHLGIEDAYAEILENRSHLIEFLNRIAATADVREVVLNGDILDEWYLPLSFNETDRDAFYQEILENNRGVLAAFKNIMDAGIKLVYVVGNHDMSITPASIEEAIPGIVVCSDRLGLGLYRTGDRSEIVIEHGHRYDVFSAPDTITNSHLVSGPTMFPPGYFYARYAADWVISGKPSFAADLPIISTVPDRTTNPDQFAAYAYYRTLATEFSRITLGNAFGDALFDIRIDGYDDVYSVKDMFPVLNEQGEISAPVLFPNYQRTWDARQQANGVQKKASFIEAALGALGGDYIETQARLQFEVDKAHSDTSVVLFGHSHIPAFYDYGNNHYYVNTGTWIDHNVNYKEADGSYLARTFAVVTTGPSNQVGVYQYTTDGKLRDIKDLLLSDLV